MKEITGTQPSLMRTRARSQRQTGSSSRLTRFAALPKGAQQTEARTAKRTTAVPLQETMKQQLELQRQMQTYAGTSGVLRTFHDSHQALLRGIKGA